MSDVSIEAAVQLEVALEAIGAHPEREADLVRLPELGIKVSIEDTELREGGVVVVYDLRTIKRDEQGMRVLAVGRGKSQTQALGEAAFQWTTGVFTVVRHWLQPSAHTCFADDFHMLVRSDDAKKEFAWRVHRGPVLSRVFGGDDADVSSPGTTEITEVLFDHVQTHAAHRDVFWIEAFVIRYSDGRLDSTCRLRNEDWSPGASALVDWASTWEIPKRATLSVRQFLLFEPIATRELPNLRKLRNALDERSGTAVPWWKRVFG